MRGWVIVLWAVPLAACCFVGGYRMGRRDAWIRVLVDCETLNVQDLNGHPVPDAPMICTDPKTGKYVDLEDAEKGR